MTINVYMTIFEIVHWGCKKDLFFFNITCCSFKVRSSPLNKPQIQIIKNI